MTIGELIEKYLEKLRLAELALSKERTDTGFLSGSLLAYKEIVADLSALPIPHDLTVWDIYVYAASLDGEEFPFSPVVLGLSLPAAVKEAERWAEELCPEGFYWVVHPRSGKGVGQIKGKYSTHHRADVLLRGVKLNVK